MSLCPGPAKAALKTIRQAKRAPPKASKTAGGSEPSKKDADRDPAGSAAEDGGKADSAGADSESP